MIRFACCRWLVSLPGLFAFAGQHGGGYRSGVADQMDISVHTVRSYIRRSYEKLQVHSRTEAVAKFRGH